MSFFKKILFNSPNWLECPILRRKIKIDEKKLKGVSFKIADSIDELSAAFRLVHDAYVKVGYMDPVPSGMRVTKYNTLPYSTTFVGKEHGAVVLTMSLIPDSEYGLPMDAIYKIEVDALRKKGRKVAEIGSLASHPEFRNSNQNIPMYGNKIVHSYARCYLGIDDLVITISPKHRWFYECILLFEQLGGEKPYDYVKGSPAIAMRLDMCNVVDLSLIHI